MLIGLGFKTLKLKIIPEEKLFEVIGKGFAPLKRNPVKELMHMLGIGTGDRNPDLLL